MIVENIVNENFLYGLINPSIAKIILAKIIQAAKLEMLLEKQEKA